MIPTPNAWLLLAALIGAGATGHPSPGRDEVPPPPRAIQAIFNSHPDCREVAAQYNYEPTKAKTFVVWYCIGAEIPLP